MCEKNQKYNVIDLFSGAGGLSEGFMQTGKYNFLSHIEWEIPMVNTLRNNLIKRWGYSENKALESVIRFDIQKTDELINGSWKKETIEKYSKDNSKIIKDKGLNGIIKNQTVDVIIGGPPCQAYSIAGRAQDPNSMRDDYRNYLFESFVKIVDFYKPSVFVFENVPGILSARPGNQLVIERIFTAFEQIGYQIRTPKLMKQSIYSAVDYGVPQERKRVIIFGVKNDSKIKLEDLYKVLNDLKENCSKVTVKEAIGDMAKFKPLEKPYKKGRRNISHEMVGTEELTQHISRYVNLRDISIYREWILKDMNYVSTIEKLQYYQSKIGKRTNHNKYRNLEWNKPSPTIVSHLYKDGHMFIHPDPEQARSITIREAAILQSFPKDYEFIGSDAYCYKMIGNAVPVLFAKKIGEAVTIILDKSKECGCK